MQYAPLDNQVAFKHAFTNKLVFEQFINDFFDLNISVSKIETEKKFYEKASNIDITMDIYAETDDHRFVIEIQKIQYDHNFDRFLHYFISVLIEQQRNFRTYKLNKTVLGVVILTRPYQFDKLNGEPILDNYFVIDFNPRNIKNEVIELNKHQLKFINTSRKYKNDDNELPTKIQDWFNLFQKTIYDNVKLQLNFNNDGIKKASEMLIRENISGETLTKIKQAEGARIVMQKQYEKGLKKGEKKLQEEKEKRIKAEQEKTEAKLETLIFKSYFSEKKTIQQIIEITKRDKKYIKKIIGI